ncbi:Tim10/DDP family zinc finger [Dictyocaulus viviparus]|uniref:Mitochondrial import inner membrane translocase subunit n=1 Tax=Dictyocaulus viviparus TaxID=29172 RepID=A0A0D8Y8D7_DICVI|nr:Tim10/DDP family zinc finger [Dictyocaulus viviparus]
MMFPSGLGSSELQQAASEKVKRDVGKFVMFGLLIEAGKKMRTACKLRIDVLFSRVHTLTGRCWDVCFADYRPPSKLDGKTTTCIQNCVNRMVDASNFMVEHLQKMEGGKGMA